MKGNEKSDFSQYQKNRLGLDRKEIQATARPSLDPITNRRIGSKDLLQHYGIELQSKKIFPERRDYVGYLRNHSGTTGYCRKIHVAIRAGNSEREVYRRMAKVIFGFIGFWVIFCGLWAHPTNINKNNKL